METQQQQQEWRRRAGRRSAADTGGTALSAGSNGHLYPSTGGISVNTGHTVSSSSKIVRKSATQSINGHAKPSAVPIPPSRWKELRQSVRIKATMDTEEHRITNARIADLREEDREKVAKLIRRIVEIGTLQEEAETEFSRQRGLYEAEIRELRDQVKRDASELEDLSDKLKVTLLKLRDYQERVLVLEESSDVEARHRLETDQTMDLLKMEIEKLRKLVRKQKEEASLKDQEEQSKFKLELERVQQQLRDAQEELLRERRDRIQEKQKELDERLMKSMTSNASAAAASENALSQGISAALSSSHVHQSEGVPTPSIPQLDMSSFLNTSIELPERIKDIMDEWKQRMEDAIAGTVRNVAGQSRVMSSTSQGFENAENSRESCEEGEEVKEGDADVSNDDEDEEEHHDTADHSYSQLQNESNPRTSRAQQQQQSLQSVWRKKLQLGSVPKVNRKPFDKHLSIESEVGSEAESSGQGLKSPRSREVSFQEEDEEDEEDQMGRTRQRRRESERRDIRTERSDRTPARPHHHRHRTRTLKSSSTETWSQNQRRHRREQLDDNSHDEEDCTSYSHESNHIFEEDEDGDDNEDDNDEAREHGRTPEVDLMNSDCNQPFVFINSGYLGDRKAGVSSSFSSLYETSLFDAVDAMEGAQAYIQTSPQQKGTTTSQTARNSQQHDAVHSQHFIPGNSTSSSTRFQSLLQGMQARERKLARLDKHDSSLLIDREDRQRTMSSGFNGVDDEVDDFEIFNEVKDIYEKELFASRQQRGPWASAGGGGTSSPAISQHNLQLHPQSSCGLSDSRESSLGPPLSQQDLSVREAIEKEMTELLQEEAFQELLH